MSAHSQPLQKTHVTRVTRVTTSTKRPIHWASQRLHVGTGSRTPGVTMTKRVTPDSTTSLMATYGWDLYVSRWKRQNSWGGGLNLGN